jgi:hypothetical protein
MVSVPLFGRITAENHQSIAANSGWTSIYEAVAINDAGQITGSGNHSTLGRRAFLFTPAAGATPASIIAFGDSNTYPQWINGSGQIAGRQYGRQRTAPSCSLLAQVVELSPLWTRLADLHVPIGAERRRADGRIFVSVG